MSRDGKQLESLVAFVEKLHLPEGFRVTTNERVFNDEGVQIAEFDIEVSGKVGTTEINWLIECRDRPGHGAAPASWIEQLVGRRTRFKFNKVTAVSTTGFAAGAADFARNEGIELREVRSLAPEEFEEWLQLKAMTQRLRISELHHANIIIDDSEPNIRKLAAIELLKTVSGADAILVPAAGGNALTTGQAFLGAVQTIEGAFDNVTPEKPRKLHLLVDYPTPDHYCLITAEGSVRVARIEFFGELRIQETMFPVVRTVEYRHVETGDAISQVAAFEPQTIAGAKLSIELHRIAESGLTHVAIRRVPDEA